MRILVGIVLTLVTLAVAVMAVLFAMGETGWVTVAGLTDPSRGPVQAGRWFGAAILSALLLASASLAIRHVVDLLHNGGAAGKARASWTADEPALAAGQATREEVLDRLRKAVPKDSRIAAVLKAWRGSRDCSDGRQRLEASAASYRQSLQGLQQVASVLVLVGLVGNFFGLAHAVERLPRLIPSASPVAAEPLQTVTSTLEYDVTVSRTAPAPRTTPEGQTQTRASVVDISAGLSVVVVSSVAGIGGMIVLVLCVALARSSLHSAMRDEIAVLDEEIGPGLSTSSDHRSVLEAVAKLPEQLEAFARDAGGFTSSLDRVSKDLAGVLKEVTALRQVDLEQTRKAYEGYQASLREFSEAFQDEKATLVGMHDAADRTATRLDEVASSVAGLAGELQRIYQTYAESLLRFDAYARLANEVLQEDRATMQQAYERMATRQDEALRVGMQRVLDDVRADVTRFHEESVNALSRGVQRVGQEAEGISRSIAAQRGDVLEQWRQLSADVAREREMQLQVWREQIPAAMSRIDTVHRATQELMVRWDTSVQAQTAGAQESLASIADEFRRTLQSERTGLVTLMRDLSFYARLLQGYLRRTGTWREEAAG